MRTWSPLRPLGLLLVLSFVPACGGGGGGGASVDPNAPVISHLRANFGGRCTLSGGLPGTGIAITGSPTSGTITLTSCFRFGSNDTVSEQVKVTDVSGKVSNELRIDVPRPGGAPLLPRDADPAIRKSL